jgi:hypothetical protein
MEPEGSLPRILDSMLSHMNPVYILTLIIFKIYFNIILVVVPTSPE